LYIYIHTYIYIYRDLFELQLHHLRECQQLSGIFIEFAFDMYFEQNSLASSAMYLSMIEGSGRY